MRIRNFKRSDAESCSELIINSINSGVFENPDEKVRLLSEHTKEELLNKSEDINYFVAENGKKVIGLGGIKSSGEIKTIYVDINHRGKGIGQAIMNHLENIASKRGLKKLFLWSSPQAINFYKSLGFKLNGKNSKDTYMEKKINK